MHFKVNRETLASCLPATEEAAEGLESFLQLVEQDDTWQNAREVCYTIATVCHDTDQTFIPSVDDLPVEDFAAFEPYTMRGCELGNRREGDGYKYRKRGYVPMMGRNVYTKLMNTLTVDLITAPAMLEQPNLAYDALRIGMTQGLFTGHRMDGYITPASANYVEARRVINRLKDANVIASLAHAIQEAEAITDAESYQQQSA